jgi:hypothetical protein
MLGMGRLVYHTYFGQYQSFRYAIDYLTFVLGGIHWRMFNMAMLGGRRGQTSISSESGNIRSSK